VASGLHGVGVSAVNALSAWMETTVRHDGREYQQRYERGKPATKVQDVRRVLKDDEFQHGTVQHFMADEEVFKSGIDFKFEALAQRFREMAFLTRGLTITFRDERDTYAGNPHERSFHFEGGIRSFVRYLNKTREAIHPPIYVEKQVNGTAIEAAIQYTDEYNESVTRSPTTSTR